MTYKARSYKYHVLPPCCLVPLILKTSCHIVRKPRPHAEAMCRVLQLTARFVSEDAFKVIPAQSL